MLSPILISLKVATVATLFSFLIGTAAAYILHKKDFLGKNLLETLLLMPLVLPPSVTGYLLLCLLGKRGIVGQFLMSTFHMQIVFTWVGAAIVAAIVSLPLMYQNAKAAFLSVDPIYGRAAATLGSGRVRKFYTITLPMAYSGILCGVVISFARALGEFGATLMVAGNIPGKTQTMATAIYFASDADNKALANTLVAVMTVVSFTLIFIMNYLQKRKKRSEQKHG